LAAIVAERSKRAQEIEDGVSSFVDHVISKMVLSAGRFE
jgi:hypothetical protein